MRTTAGGVNQRRDVSTEDDSDISRNDSTKTTETDYHREVKVVMVGESGVGKTSLTGKNHYDWEIAMRRLLFSYHDYLACIMTFLIK